MNPEAQVHRKEIGRSMHVPPFSHKSRVSAHSLVAGCGEEEERGRATERRREGFCRIGLFWMQ